MPPRTRKNTTTEPDSPAQACPICFPAGIPAGTFSVGCEHGTWSAADPQPETEQPAAEAEAGQ